MARSRKPNINAVTRAMRKRVAKKRAPAINAIRTTAVPCALCRQPTTAEHFCFGCKMYVCIGCDEAMPMGKHDVGDHRSHDHG